jgi:nucleoid-associated protein YgaU
MTQQPGQIATCALYTIQPGDTLQSIAERAYGDGTKWQLIYNAPQNQFFIGDNPDLIQPGQDLFIPAQDSITQGANYTVQTGDTLQSIAERAYCDANQWQVIYNMPQNQQVIGDNPDLIQPGQILYIPSPLDTPSGGGGGHVH